MDQCNQIEWKYDHIMIRWMDGCMMMMMIIIINMDWIYMWFKKCICVMMNLFFFKFSIIIIMNPIEFNWFLFCCCCWYISFHLKICYMCVCKCLSNLIFVCYFGGFVVNIIHCRCRDLAYVLGQFLCGVSIYMYKCIMIKQESNNNNNGNNSKYHESPKINS